MDKVHEPYMRGRLGTLAHFCEVVAKSQSGWSHQFGDTSLFPTPLQNGQLASESELEIGLGTDSI